MHLKKLFLFTISSLALLLLTPTSADAKTWHYSVTPSNSFSHKTYAQAYMYGNYEYMELYKTKQHAQTQDTDTGQIISNSKKFYARKTSSKQVYEVIYQHKYYYMNTNDTRLYRYNTWRSGHKLISTVKPNQPSKVMLKAKTHVYRSQYWLYDYSGQNLPLYNWYRLADTGKWVVDASK